MDPAALQALQLQLPNPFTPMAFLPPDLAFQVTISNYTVVGSLAVMIWDIVINLSCDWRLLTQYRVRTPTLIYFLSRWSTLAYLIGTTILLTAPVGSVCSKFRFINILYTFAIPSTSLLFVLRVQAIYRENKAVIAISSALWLCVLAGCITPIFGLDGQTIGITKYCIQSKLEPYVSAAAIAPLVNDTFVFLATTWRLLQNAHGEAGLKGNLQTLFLGRNLPLLSKAMLQDGQVYYLTTISLNLVTDILFFNTSVPVAYRSLIGVPNIVLMNCMACYVFRNVKFGIFTRARSQHTSDSSSIGMGIQFKQTAVTFPTTISSRTEETRTDKDVVEITPSFQAFPFFISHPSQSFPERGGSAEIMDPGQVAADASSLELPNPFSPLAFLPPDQAHQVMVSSYLAVGTLAIPNGGLSSVEARLFILIKWAAPIGSACFKLHYLHLLCIIAVPSTSLLFSLRVHSVYQGQHIVTTTASALWICLVATCITPIFGLRGELLGVTKYCVQNELKYYVSTLAVASLVNNVFAFVAIAVRLMKISRQHGCDDVVQSRWRMHRNATILFKALFQDGQVHYLLAICLNIVSTVFVLNPRLPVFYRFSVGLPTIVLMNCMACLVFRNAKFGIFTLATGQRRPELGPLVFKHPTTVLSSLFTQTNCTEISSDDLATLEEKPHSKSLELHV
ncbi:hypothetical protein CVT24_010250 [Panaeolus cyanescens]|uniref:DUF6533 domain-containing protein n=1 Tax=Panaeolus cyanescens TaxID=181874 RepID=A0A409YP29_9AGAR|nr:hypothetical protein CVT24_010250 [Panaeolus cyanescens]